MAVNSETLGGFWVISPFAGVQFWTYYCVSPSPPSQYNKLRSPVALPPPDVIREHPVGSAGYGRGETTSILGRPRLHQRPRQTRDGVDQFGEIVADLPELAGLPRRQLFMCTGAACPPCPLPPARPVGVEIGRG